MTVMDEAPSKSRALVSETKYVKIADNDKFDVRTGTITIKDKNNSSTSVTIPVSQYGLAKPIILVNNASEFASLSAAEATIDLNLYRECGQRMRPAHHRYSRGSQGLALL